MPFNGSGSYNLPGAPLITGGTVDASEHNTLRNDLATALTDCVTRDGQSPAAANLPMAGFKHTGVANALARTDYAAMGQVQDSSLQYLSSVAGTNTITATLTNLAAYAVGQTFRFIVAGANTGAVTLNINSLGAKAITKNGTTALISGDLISSAVLDVVYDGTRFQIVQRRASLIAFTPASGPDTDVQASLSAHETSLSAHETRLSEYEASGGANLIGDIQSGTGTVATTVHNKINRKRDILDFFTTAQKTDYLSRAKTLDLAVPLQTAANALSSENFTLDMLSGAAATSAQIVITRSAGDVYGMGITSDGRGRAEISYTGSASIGSLLKLTVASGGFSLNNSIKGLKLNVTGAPSGTGGLIINAGVWRSRFDDIYVMRDIPAGVRSGVGIYMGSATLGAAGCFDNKFSGLYVNNFDINLHFQGTDGSGNTVTNTTIDHSYIANANTNLRVEWFNGVSTNNSQYELAVNYGIYLVEGDTYTQMGGSIESPTAGAIGIGMDANTQSVVAICDFFNNSGGHFVTNGKVGHLYKSANSGLVHPPGSELRFDRDATYNAYLRMFKNGTADVRLTPAASGNAFDITNAAGTIYYTFDVTNKLLIGKNGAAFMLNNGTAQSAIYSNNGTPEGVITANAGSLCMDTTGGAGNTFYVKESGSGNTGWVAK